MAKPMERPLSGIRVIGLEQYVAAPYCTMLMADAGAEVIKIERLVDGDPRRMVPPFAEKGGVRKGAGFMSFNRNKKSVAVDLRNPKGQEILRALAAKSDVVVENLKPGSMDRIGLGHEALRALNARLVVALISGFGRMPEFIGPYSDRPAFDIIGEAMSGVMHAVGFADKPPSPTVYALADMCAGLFAMSGIMQALYMRERTGEGQLVDASLVDSMLSLNARTISEYSVAGQSIMRGRSKNIHPRGAYQTKDGYVALSIPNNIIWRRLAAAMGRDDLIEDERTQTGPLRSTNWELVDNVLNAWLSKLTRDEAVDTLNSAGVPAAPVFTSEDIIADPHISARGMIMTIDDPDVGPSQFVRSSPHLSSNPTLPTDPAPDLGQHTRQVLEGVLGYDGRDIDRLVAENVIQTAAENDPLRTTRRSNVGGQSKVRQV